jgi:hypothetical protein
MKVEDIQKLNVPKYEELSLNLVYIKALNKFPELEDYFPHYHDKYIPPREFFWGVLSTLYPEVVKKIIKRAHEK